jgi:hypothetical protein
MSKTTWLTQFKEKNTVYYENGMRHVNTLRGQNVEFYNVEAGITW